MNGRPLRRSKYRLDELVEAYIDCRRMIESIEERHKQELAKPRKLKEMLTERLLDMLAATGQEMARTKFGTVSAATRDTASCSDPNIFVDYVREHDAYELMDRRPNSTACRAFLEEHGELPPGVKLNVLQYVNVRAAHTEGS